MLKSFDMGVPANVDQTVILKQINKLSEAPSA
jgi:hypothetical protein